MMSNMITQVIPVDQRFCKFFDRSMVSPMILSRVMWSCEEAKKHQRKKYYRDGFFWCAQLRSEMAKQWPYATSEASIRRHFQQLEKAGWLISCVDPRDRRKWYRLNPAKLEEHDLQQPANAKKEFKRPMKKAVQPRIPTSLAVGSAQNAEPPSQCNLIRGVDQLDPPPIYKEKNVSSNVNTPPSPTKGSSGSGDENPEKPEEKPTNKKKYSPRGFLEKLIEDPEIDPSQDLLVALKPADLGQLKEFRQYRLHHLFPWYSLSRRFDPGMVYWLAERFASYGLRSDSRPSEDQIKEKIVAARQHMRKWENTVNGIQDGLLEYEAYQKHLRDKEQREEQRRQVTESRAAVLNQRRDMPTIAKTSFRAMTPKPNPDQEKKPKYIPWAIHKLKAKKAQENWSSPEYRKQCLEELLSFNLRDGNERIEALCELEDEEINTWLEDIASPQFREKHKEQIAQIFAHSYQEDVLGDF
jgi:hypothetical protein